MSEEISGSFMVVWGFGGMIGIFVMAAAGGDLMHLTLPPLLEWMMLFFVAAAMAESDSEDAMITQRKDETNAHFAMRAWVSVHLLILKIPFIALAAVPGKLSQALSWLRKTPADNHE